MHRRHIEHPEVCDIRQMSNQELGDYAMATLMYLATPKQKRMAEAMALSICEVFLRAGWNPRAILDDDAMAPVWRDFPQGRAYLRRRAW